MASVKIDTTSPGYMLFNKHFMVNIPVAFMFNEKYIALHGTQSSGDRQYDMLIANESRLLTRALCNDEDNPHMTISIVELLNMGVDVTFYDPADSKLAYSIIMDQLEDIAQWLRKQSYTAIRGAEWEGRQQRLLADSTMLIAAANMIHPVAVRNTKEHENSSSLVKFLNTFGGMAATPTMGFPTAGMKNTELLEDGTYGHDAGVTFNKNLDSVTTKRLHQWRVD